MSVFCDYLSVSTLVPLILNMFIDIATSSPVIFVDHVTTLKQLAEQQPVYIHQVVQIIGAIGTVSQVGVGEALYRQYWAVVAKENKEWKQKYS